MERVISLLSINTLLRKGIATQFPHRPMQSCLSGQSREVLDLDYRDAAIIHGFRFVPEFGSSCIMAHIDQDEAFAPLKLLEKRLIITILSLS